MATEHEPGDPTSQVIAYFNTEVDPQLRKEFFDHCARTEKKQSRSDKRKEIMHRKSFRTGVALVLAAALMTGIFEWSSTYKREARSSREGLKAEALIEVLTSPYAVRALNLTPGRLNMAEITANNWAASSKGLTAEGYADMVRLYKGASSLAVAAGNKDLGLEDLTSYPSYTVPVNNEYADQEVSVTANEIYSVSPAVANRVALFYRSIASS